MSRQKLFLTVISTFFSSSALAQSDVPVGTVVAWLKSSAGVPQLLDGWLECNGQVVNDVNSPINGQTLPDLNGATGPKRFLRGSTTSGTTGGSETHDHGGLTGQAPTEGNKVTPGGLAWNTTQHQHPIAAASSLPSYYEAVWIMKIRAAVTPGVPAVGGFSLLVMGILILAAGAVIVARRGGRFALQ